jgi:hypothetical protein
MGRGEGEGHRDGEGEGEGQGHRDGEGRGGGGGREPSKPALSDQFPQTSLCLLKCP